MEFLKFALVIILATAVVINIIFVFHYAFANKLLPQVVMYINKRQNKKLKKLKDAFIQLDENFSEFKDKIEVIDPEHQIHNFEETLEKRDQLIKKLYEKLKSGNKDNLDDIPELSINDNSDSDENTALKREIDTQKLWNEELKSDLNNAKKKIAEQKQTIDVYKEVEELVEEDNTDKPSFNGKEESFTALEMFYENKVKILRSELEKVKGELADTLMNMEELPDTSSEIENDLLSADDLNEAEQDLEKEDKVSDELTEEKETKTNIDSEDLDNDEISL